MTLYAVLSVIKVCRTHPNLIRKDFVFNLFLWQNFYCSCSGNSVSMHPYT